MRYPQFPEPIGVIRDIQRPTYEESVLGQIQEAIQKRGQGDLRKLYYATHTWEVLPEAGDGRDGHERTTQETAPSVPSEFDDEYTGVAFHGEGEEKAAPPLLDAVLADLHPRRPLTASADISLAEAIDILQKYNAGFLALLDDNGKLAGVFTEGDVFTKVAGQVKRPAVESVRNYMTQDVITLQPNDRLAYALHLMATHKIRHIPLVDDDGRPVGVLSFRTVVHYLKKNFAA
ncbi:MAG: CBS domain-containing protein [Chloroflexi bacterium]|nr:MAG: CBS domain-containing protein [Chloroflexota bacterium]